MSALKKVTTLEIMIADLVTAQTDVDEDLTKLQVQPYFSPYLPYLSYNSERTIKPDSIDIF